jgi:hypothetical protein
MTSLLKPFSHIPDDELKMYLLLRLPSGGLLPLMLLRP